MLRVLQHYLPIRTAFLVFGEALLLVAIVGAGMSNHLWELLAGRRSTNYPGLSRSLARLGLEPQEGLTRCLVSATLITLISMIAIGFNQLYEFHISSSRFRRAARFVESLGIAIALNLGLLIVAHLLGLQKVLDFPGLTLSQRVQTLVLTLLTAFGALYLFRIAYHGAMNRLSLNQRILILGSRGPAHSLARQVLEHPEAGYAVIGMVPEPEALHPLPKDREPLLVAPDHEATPQSAKLVLEGISILRRADRNRGAAMSGTAIQAGQELMQLVREHNIDLLVVALQDLSLIHI